MTGMFDVPMNRYVKMRETMNSVEEPIPLSERDPAVVMGRQDSLSAFCRLVAAELYVLRRRRLSKVLLVVGGAAIMVFVLLLGVFTWSLVNRPLSDFVPPFCSSGSHLSGCVTHLPTRADMEQYKQVQLLETADNLSMPSSLGSIGETLLINLLFVLVLIFAGTMVGDEYSLGTVRLLYTRGPTRLHFLFAKVATIIMCILPAALLLTLSGVILGEVLYAILGFSTSWSFFTTSWLGHAIVFVLLETLAWFAYAMLALFFGTLARSTVAAVLAPFIWDIVESALRELIRAFAAGSSGPFTTIVKAIPDYFIANNMIALLDNQGHFVFGGDLSSLSNLHAFTVLAVYLVLFIGLSCWLTVKRDVTN
jgi:ABC-type transport system involved in multi-copper enzyme maturation permease subunit